MTGERRPIADIRIGPRHRQDLGDLAALAASIKAHTLLQPIGVTPGGELVFGERRLRACRDLLLWHDIDARTVDVSSIAAGEFAENEVRKNFTPSERVAILETLERLKQGQRTDLQHSVPVPNVATASKSVGFGSESTARNARIVVRHGVPELVAAMDENAIGIRPAAKIARLPAAEQRQHLQRVTTAREVQLERDKRYIKAGAKLRQISIPWSAPQAARKLAGRWPPRLCRDLIDELQRRLAAAERNAA